MFWNFDYSKMTFIHVQCLNVGRVEIRGDFLGFVTKTSCLQGPMTLVTRRRRPCLLLLFRGLDVATLEP